MYGLISTSQEPSGGRYGYYPHFIDAKPETHRGKRDSLKVKLLVSWWYRNLNEPV